MIYYNFVNKKEYLSKVNFNYDYYWYAHGFILSERLLKVFKEFKIQESVCKKIKFTVAGEIIDSPGFYLLKFNTYNVAKPAPDFVDYNKTELLPSKTIYVVTKKLVLKENIDFDIFKPGKVELLASAGIVVTEEVKNAIEFNNCGRGIRFLPIETAQEEYCIHNFKDFNDLIKKTRAKLP